MPGGFVFCLVLFLLQFLPRSSSMTLVHLLKSSAPSFPDLQNGNNNDPFLTACKMLSTVPGQDNCSINISSYSC